jgi:site-specific DNA recombinase
MFEPKRRTRCAIYTRKSSEEGLEQDFNSLDAQREACEAFITSQKHEGWQIMPARYDDGGYSGGSMERPGLTRLLADIASGQIDVVVVYKVDRLTRSLTDFAKIVEVFDKSGASFVSVTQAFNTTTSMGRLTLNVLLSFAQFEREVTGERIRDKIAASKKKGLWMGGFVPIGYEAAGRTLVINEAEAETIRTIYNLYLDLRSVDALKAELDRRGLHTKIRTGPTGASGGQSFARGHLYSILNNPLYAGRIRHKGQVYEGQHPAIIAPPLWDQVQGVLVANLQGQRLRTRAKSPNLLSGLLFDHNGEALLSTHAVKQGVRYRYYVSASRLKPRPQRKGGDANLGLRLAASEIEAAVLLLLTRLLCDRDWLNGSVLSPDARLDEQRAVSARAEQMSSRLDDPEPASKRDVLLTLVERVVVAPNQIEVTLKPDSLTDAYGQSGATLTLTRPIALRRRGVETKLILEGESASTSEPDPTLLKALGQAHRWWRDLLDRRYATMREIAQAYDSDERYVARVIALVFLPTSLTRQIMAGIQPPEMTLYDLLLGDEKDAWAGKY